MKILFHTAIPVLLLFMAVSCEQAPKPPAAAYNGWGVYAGTKDASRYADLTEINTRNVNRLQVAWTYSSGDKDTAGRSQLQCNPIVVDSVLYATSPRLKLLALHAATGRPLWTFDPYKGDTAAHSLSMNVNRGVTYWQDETGRDKRIFYAVGADLYAIDAESGEPIGSFGENGKIDLHEGLDRAAPDAYIAGTTPGIIYKDLLIVGMRVSETADAAPGHIRAYDVRTGKRRWIFHTIPHPGEEGYDTWQDTGSWRRNGGVNCWSGMSLDEQRGIVYVPLGSATYDFYGGNRKGQNLFANCILALDAATGKRIWHYQTVHHDLWDRDLPSNPNLVTVKHNGKWIDALAQCTKSGNIFLLDRTNGRPLFPVKEVAAPPSTLPGESAWPVQPVPELPEPFTRQVFTEKDITDISPAAHDSALKRFRQVLSGRPFIPPDKRGIMIFPGFDGGAEWGGAAFDPATQLLYVNANEMPWIMEIIDIPKNKGIHTARELGRSVYDKYCMSCHGKNLQGDAQQVYPSLQHLNKRYNQQQTAQVINNGRNMMPAFRQIPDNEKKALLTFLLELDTDKEEAPISQTPAAGGILAEIPYTTTGYNRFVDKEGYPAIKPPWGTLSAIDLNTGKIRWQRTLGEFKALSEKGIPPTGTENYGGPLVTAGGLLFIGATKDEHFRAFDKTTGNLLWQTTLPAGGYATPCTYSVNGKQYVVIAAGGGKMGTRSGDTYVAFALPE